MDDLRFMKTLSQLSKETGLHRTTLYYAICRKKFPAENHGGFWLVDEFSPEFSAYIKGMRKHGPQKPPDNVSLTQREKEVLGNLWYDIQDKEIAASLHITIHTLHFHLRSIYRKIGVRNRKGAIAYALEKGIIDGNN